MSMLQFLLVLADAPADQTTKAPPGIDLWILLPAMAFLFYFIIYRPMRRQDQERNALINTLKKNDKVLTSSGIYGTIVAISEKEDEITVKVDDNVRLRMIKSSIARNLTNEEAKAAKPAKSAE
jgi:preprotein translocase subunit YajC